MTDLQRLQLRASDIRSKLATLAGEADLTDEQRTDMDAMRSEYSDNERRQASLTIAGDSIPEPVEATETELDALIVRSNVGNIFTAAMEHRPAVGVERELQQHFGLGGNFVPLEMLETRAVSPAPANVGQNQAAIEPYVFPNSVTAFLGIAQPTVAFGDAVYPTLTSTLAVRTPAENASAAETTGSFVSEVLSPKRLQASFFYSIESRAQFAGMGEALRRNLSDGLADGLDKQMVVGTTGLLTSGVLSDHNVTAITTYQSYRDVLAYGRVDGRYAGAVSDVRVVMGSSTYAHAAKQFRSDNAGDRAAIEDLQSVTGGIRVSAHIPAVASHKQNSIVRLGLRRDMVAPIWQGIEILDDPYTKSAHGQVQIVATMLYNIKVLRAAGFYKQQSQHA